jgi:outer membrane lipoprotein-sorting protein
VPRPSRVLTPKLRLIIFVAFLFVAFLVSLLGCAPARVRLPEGSGTPVPEFSAAFATASAECRQVRTIEFVLTLTGRSGDTRLRQRVRGALARPESVRLEGVAPFGGPVFYLVSRPGQTVLFLAREGRVVSSASAGEILKALVGVELAPEDLRAVLTGCVVPEPRPLGARGYEDSWMAVDLEGGSTVYLREVDRALRLVAGRRGELRVEYGEFVGAIPRRIRVMTPAPPGGERPETDLIVNLSQLSINLELHPDAFSISVPAGVSEMTLDELRGRGLLRQPDDGL